MDEKEKQAIMKWASEVTALLAYQRDIPHQHKIDLLNAQCEMRRALGIADDVQGEPA